MATILHSITDKITWLRPKTTLSIPDDLAVEGAGVKFLPGKDEMDCICTARRATLMVSAGAEPQPSGQGTWMWM